MGSAESEADESFENGLLEYPQYTRPAEFEGEPIPEVVTSGDHKKVAQWRQEQSEELTKQNRPDLWGKYGKKT
jgi:tRNA (guanine37-N1)-methyltransferase